MAFEISVVLLPIIALPGENCRQPLCGDAKGWDGEPYVGPSAHQSSVTALT